MANIGSKSLKAGETRTFIGPIYIKGMQGRISNVDYKKMSAYDYDNDGVVDYNEIGIYNNIDLKEAISNFEKDDQIKKIDSQIDELNKELELQKTEFLKLSSYKQHAIRDGGANTKEKKELVEQKIENYEKKVEEIRKQIEELELQKEERIKELRINTYLSLMNNSDFIFNSKAKITESEAEELTKMMSIISEGNKIIINNEDFNDYNKLREFLNTHEMEGWDSTLNWDLIKSAYEKGFNIFEIANMNSHLKSGEVPYVYGEEGEKTVTYYAHKINYMKPEEVEIANYIYNTNGKEACDEYFNIMEEELNSREGLEKALNYISTLDLKDPKLKEHIKAHFKGLSDGLEQFFNGIEVWATGPSKDLSAQEYEAMYITMLLGESDANIDMGFLGEFNSLEKVYTLSMAEGNMLPSMVVGTMFDMMGIPGVGSATMFASVAGNSTEKAYQEGNELWRSWFYGCLSGASEATLERVLGGIPGVSKIADKNFVTRAISEMTEESLQEILDPYLKYVSTGEKPVVDWNNVIEAGIDGLILSAYLNSGQVIISGSKVSIDYIQEHYNTIKELENNGIEVDYTRITDNNYIEGLKKKLNDIGSKEFVKEAISNMNYIIDQHDAKYGAGSAYNRLLAFINPNSPYYGKYDIISLSGGARQILQNYSPEQVKTILSTMMGKSMGYSIRYKVKNNGYNSFFKKYGNESNYGVDQSFFVQTHCFYYNGELYTETEIKEKLKTGEIDSIYNVKETTNRENNRLNDKLRGLGFTNHLANMILIRLNSSGACTYAEVCNGIFAHFRNNPKLFKNIFGYDMYTYDNNNKLILNSGELLLDLYMFVNTSVNGGSLFIKNEDGSFAIDKNSVSSELDIYGKRQLDTSNQIFMSSEIGINTNALNRFLRSKNSNFSVKSDMILMNSSSAKELGSYNMKKIISEVNNELNKGKNVSMGIYQDVNKPIRMEFLDSRGNVIEVATNLDWNKDDGHAVFITGLDPRGFLVSSNGRKCLIPYEDIQNGGQADICSWELTM